MTEIEIRALEIARDDFELKLRHAERRLEAVIQAEAKTKRRLERQRRFPDSGEEKERLREIPCDIWVPALTGVEIPNGRRISCPLPGHEDNEPSCRFYETSFHCWSCGRSGDIFVFAGYLWVVPHNGSRFPELVKRLAELLL
jgi:hypothetical protein